MNPDRNTGLNGRKLDCVYLYGGGGGGESFTVHLWQCNQRGQYILFSVVFTLLPPATTAVLVSYLSS